MLTPDCNLPSFEFGGRARSFNIVMEAYWAIEAR